MLFISKMRFPAAGSAALALPAVLVGAAVGCGGTSKDHAAPAASATDAPRTVASAPAATVGSAPTVAVASTSGAKAADPRRPRTTIKVMKTRYGKVLVDGGGRALYLFTLDRTPASRCYGACAGTWPPFLASGGPAAGAGAVAGLIGTRGRRDGSTQVTYNGHPLYYYVGDRFPGQVLCQDVEEFGGRWYVVTRQGSAVL